MWYWLARTAICMIQSGAANVVVKADGVLEQLVNARQECIVRIVEGDKNRVVQVDERYNVRRQSIQEHCDSLTKTR